MKRILSLCGFSVSVGLCMLAIGAVEPAPATPAPQPAATTPAPKADPVAMPAKEASKETTKKAETNAVPAAPALAPGAIGDLASLQKHFPNLKASSKPDGTIVVEERFAIKGKGTQEDPFIVTWDQLAAASEVYDPRKGQKKIPDFVQMLDGQYVTVTGFVAFPIAVKEPKEMLAMLNQWDGCCIGVPPTPYDAIEVHLKDAATKDQRMATYGTVSGRLTVKPYLVGDWLVGLYVMDQAVVSKPKQTGMGT